jgi:hypothetical protein
VMIQKLFFALAAIAMGCGSKSNDYLKTISSAKAGVPYAAQMERLFGDADHFILHYGHDENPMKWNTVVWFDDKYILTMIIRVNVNYSANTVMAVGDPEFILHEITKIDIKSDGRVEAHYGGQANHSEFDLDEWNTIYLNGGDFSKIGICIEKVPVPGFKDYLLSFRKDRIHVSLVQ